MVINGFVSVVISTIERRFDLTSVESGLIASGYDIACVLCLMPVSYFGGVAHKPRWIGTGVFLLGLGSFLFSLPHFTAGSYNYESSQESNICHRNSPQANFTLQQSRHSDLETCDRADHQISPLDQPTSLSNFKYILFMAQLLHGVGATPIFTLAVTYLDDNLKAKMTPMYVGKNQFGTVPGS